MATTSIWAVKGYLGKVVVYIENPEKTENPAYFEKPDMTDSECQRLDDVIEYATNSNKTEMKKFVTAVGCNLDTAREEMLITKRRWEKEGGRVGFHGYQSFAEGEVTPEIAHEIGVKLAEELWGEDFQVVVATHLDHQNHIHNHYVLNSVAYSDGHRFDNNKADYRRMRETSDRLCREYGLSVIESAKSGKAKHYAEWRAEKEGKPTWRGIIKADVDEAIQASMTDTQFFAALKQKGYEIKFGKDISVRPPGKGRFVRLARNFGERYMIDSIKRRILSQQRAFRPVPSRPPRRSIYKRTLTLGRRRRIGGLLGIYLHYQYLLGNIPKRRTPRHGSFTYKEDLLKLNMISAETKLLFRYRIETEEQLITFTDGRLTEINKLTEERNTLRRDLKKNPDPEEIKSIKAEITGHTASLKELRKDVRLADDIAVRSGVIREKIKGSKDISKETIEKKEVDRNELFR